MPRPRFRHVVPLLLVAWLAVVVRGQVPFETLDYDHPAIRYTSTAPSDRVALLARRIAEGQTVLRFDNRTGYLPSLLEALDIPVESQMLVYSKTSLQQRIITPQNPRAIFFNDSVSVAWVPGGFIEIAAQDPQQGAVFYAMQQTPRPPQLLRDGRCVRCHHSRAAGGVVGFLNRSVPTARDGDTLPWLGNATVDHRTPLLERWGGWYVTGYKGTQPHLGNATLDGTARELPTNAALSLGTVGDRIDPTHYLSTTSDVVALLVFDHQTHLMNLLTRVGWEARVSAAGDASNTAASMSALVTEVVDYLLFVDEAPPLGAPGESAFAKAFVSGGPRDGQGRSLRDLGLPDRLLRYSCSYMIYSAAFDGLPADVKDAIYRRLWQVLSGEAGSAKYARLTRADRQAIVDILRATKAGLPAFYDESVAPL